MLRTVPCYAAALAVIFVVLSVRVIGLRRSGRVTLGAGGNAELERRIRVHGNFAEYVPFALVLLTMAELRGASPVTLNVFGLALVAGRVVHAIGVSRSPEDYRLRVFGMAATLFVLIGAALSIVAT